MIELSVNQLACRRGDRVLFSDLSFTLSAGKSLLIEGKNGCGKTTLLKTLSGLRAIDEGSIMWNGDSIQSQHDKYHRQLFWVGHLLGLKLDLSPLENLRFSSQLRREKIAIETLEDNLVLLGLRHCIDLPVRMLSQGQKKKVLLANLLISQASLWILDEPFVGLDVEAVEWLLQTMKTHLDNEGMIVLTTHQKITLPDDQLTILALDLWSGGQVKREANHFLDVAA